MVSVGGADLSIRVVLAHCGVENGESPVVVLECFGWALLLLE